MATPTEQMMEMTLSANPGWSNTVLKESPTDSPAFTTRPEVYTMAKNKPTSYWNPTTNMSSTEKTSALRISNGISISVLVLDLLVGRAVGDGVNDMVCCVGEFRHRVADIGEMLEQLLLRPVERDPAAFCEQKDRAEPVQRPWLVDRHHDGGP
ncbi:hypothetical protein OGAPHI_000469 [Ogataea philodendri]|uniref:Uncharacterized protein n=1 Tax=Ogataea philodendri TaxID=1378263 RepID=A0A9P8PG05_9ASCO|nr:uncharacterized protein OGAPHI_000469 [Ogataea philodendri]KAH3671246.1 hypothetical protein OGAPHI_000469 [Ogataea philodendri]